MLWYQGTQDIGQSNREVKSALTCIVWSQCTPIRTDMQTDR